MVFESEKWIKVNDAANVCQMPARTIRYHALRGNIRAAKNGKDWFVEVASLFEQGWIEPGTTISDSILHPEPQLRIAPHAASSRQPTTEEIVQLTDNLRRLKAFQLIDELKQNPVLSTPESAPILASLEAAMVHAVEAEMEPSVRLKQQMMILCRRQILHALIRSQTRTTPETSHLLKERLSEVLQEFQLSQGKQLN